MSDQQNEQFSRQIIPLAEINPNPVLGVKPDGLIIYANSAGTLFLNSVSTSINSLLPVLWADEVKEAFKSGKAKNLEMQAAEKIYSVNLVPLQEPGIVYIYCNDITAFKKSIELYEEQPIIKKSTETIDKKDTTNRLNESEAKYKNLVEASQDFIYTADPKGHFTYINPVGIKITGYSEEEIIGKHFTYLVRDDWKLPVAQYYKKQFENRLQDSYFEFPFMSKDGQEWWVGQNVMIITENNWVKGFQAYARNITARRKAEIELSKQQLFIATILDNLPISIYLKDREGKYVFVNKHALELSKINSGDILGKPASQFYPKEFAESIIKADEETWHNKSYLSEEKVVVNGVEQHLIVGKIVLHMDELDDPLLLGYSVDISKQKKTEQELLKANQKAEESIRAKERFISIMSHEIRTPMNAVVGITNLLLSQVQNPDQKEYFNALKISSENLLRILNDVLDLSKIESGKVTFEEIDFKLSEVLTQVKDLFVFRASEKNVVLSVKIDPKIPESLKGDPHRLTQVLVNLMSNAVKFTDAGSVMIKADLLESNQGGWSHVLFSVVDTGIGIPKDKLTTVFESFTQANPDITRKYGGTGLGLTITKRLVELQGGNMRVESVLNQGSTFVFDLEFSKSSVKNDTNEVQEKKYNDLSGLKALVVEDNKMNQLVVSKFLEKEKILSDIADNGLMAIELISKNHYDIVLMDLQMPEMDGYETAHYIRNKLNIKNTPIVAFTASSSLNIEMKVREAGMNDYMVKPFEPSVFYSIIAKHTNRQVTTSNDVPIMMSQGLQAIDLSYLKDASSGNGVFIKEMIGIFLNQTPMCLAQLEKLYQESNWEEFRKIMHKLKPTITMMGIKKGDVLVKEIESRVKNQKDLNEVGTILLKLDILCKQVYVELNAELNSLE